MFDQPSETTASRAEILLAASAIEELASTRGGSPLAASVAKLLKVVANYLRAAANEPHASHSLRVQVREAPPTTTH